MNTATDDPRDAYNSTRDRLLQAMLGHAAFDGWTAASFKQACADCGISAAEARIACPRGELDLIIAWSHQMDAAAEAAILSADIESMRVRERVTFCIIARLEAIGEHEEAARRARARLLLPDAATEAAQLVWQSCDRVWRAIGDQSTDFNFYTKRMILSGIYSSTLALWLQDDSEGKARARAFLDDRIENVMQYEKAKWQMRKMTENLPDLGELLGRMRYGAGPRS